MTCLVGFSLKVLNYLKHLHITISVSSTNHVIFQKSENWHCWVWYIWSISGKYNDQTRPYSNCNFKNRLLSTLFSNGYPFLQVKKSTLYWKHKTYFMMHVSKTLQGCYSITWGWHGCHTVMHIYFVAVRGGRVNATHLSETSNAICWCSFG